MASPKFVYNPKTLSFEKYQLTTAQKVSKIVLFTLAMSVYTSLVVWVAPKNTSTEKALNTELNNLRRQFKQVNTQLAEMSTALSNIQERDAAVYRQVLEMEPTEEAAGLGKNRPDFSKMSDAELLAATTQRISQVRQQIAATATSQDEILAKAQNQSIELAAMPSIRPIKDTEKPLELMSGFGYRIHPVFKIKKMHTGIDFGAPTGTPIYATAAGKIVKVENSATGYGKSVIVNHGNGFETLYAHMSVIGVKVGQEVNKGEVIGKVGSTGTSTAPHVHYEVIKNGEKINPLPFCSDGLSPADYKKMVEISSQENKTMEK